MKVSVYVQELDYTFIHNKEQLQALKKQFIVFNRQVIIQYFQDKYRSYENPIIEIAP